MTKIIHAQSKTCKWLRREPEKPLGDLPAPPLGPRDDMNDFCCILEGASFSAGAVSAGRPGRLCSRVGLRSSAGQKARLCVC